jgi:hypothetical protein
LPNTLARIALPVPIGIAADLLLLLADHEVEAVERLAGDVALDVRLVALHQAHARRPCPASAL